VVELVTADLELIDAALHDEERLGSLLDAEVAEGWVSFAGALEHTHSTLAADPAAARWGTRLFLAGDPRTFVGWGGFKGPPAGGVVELGYEIAPAYRGRGLATEATERMLDEAFAEAAVDAVIAHTLAEPGPSTRVLEKTGFAREGEFSEDGQDVWRFRRERD
jgi:[ribosomal protein S5]-alanine N-acetyltransferase